MELINQKTKKIMEGCKERALDAGLKFQDESLEYIVTNSDLVELTPKVMIPTLYDYWVQDVEVLKEKGRYELYPGNPYETVINTKPAISFYNDNNPDWLNVMIFYHVLAHIDFFQNNLYFRHTWDYDFTGKALSDKRFIAKLRAEKGRWVDYVIEFARSIDNMSGYFNELSAIHHDSISKTSKLMDFYFDVFLQQKEKFKITDYIKEVERYNEYVKKYGKNGEANFFNDVRKKHPEFDTILKKHDPDEGKRVDLLEFICQNSEFLNKEENVWMQSVIEIIRKTSLYFQPQIRTKILNEGWASFWHETLFMNDDRISGHEVAFSRVNAGVTSMPKVGLNPYALGMRLFYYIEESADAGRYNYDFQRIKDRDIRKQYDKNTGAGRDYIFHVRENMCDSMFINTFIEQDFVDKHNLFVAGKRLNEQRMTWEYYIKSRKASDYKEMVCEQLYHPPSIDFKIAKDGKTLYLNHIFEEKPLVKEFISNTMIGIEYLWGGYVQLETSEVAPAKAKPGGERMPPFRANVPPGEAPAPSEIEWQRVLYTMDNRKLSRKILD